MEKPIDPAVRAHRASDATLTLKNPDGTPAANREVIISQVKHQFLFGASWFDLPYALGLLSGEKRELSQARFERITALCNAVTLPFYWGWYEPRQGVPDLKGRRAAAEMASAAGLKTKGHPLCWHTITAPWLLEMSNAEILRTQLNRIQRDVTAFKGLIDMWDVINEAVIMPIFDKYDNGITRICKETGRINLIRMVFEEARRANPGATLLINDFDVSPAYDILVEGCLAAGIQFDVIGIQSHMHQGYWGVEKTERVLEQFNRFGLPIHFTENTIVSGKIMPPEIVDLNDYQVKEWPSTPEGEERQAEEVASHYKTLFAHPLVQSITWWDLADGGWLGAPAGLVRRDMTPKPAYEALMKLVKGEWWTGPLTRLTDKEGRLSFTGFLGDYELTVNGKKAVFSLQKKGEESVEVAL